MAAPLAVAAGVAAKWLVKKVLIKWGIKLGKYVLALFFFLIFMFINAFATVSEEAAVAKAGASCSSSGLYEPGADGAINMTIAKIAYQTAKARSASDRVILALFETGLVESGFKNYANDGIWTADRDSTVTPAQTAIAAESMDYPHDAVGTDATSVGFLQQQNWWGSPKERLDPAFATGKFLDVAITKERTVGGSAGKLAQAVQVSAFPDRYDQEEVRAFQLIQEAKNLTFPGVAAGTTTTAPPVPSGPPVADGAGGTVPPSINCSPANGEEIGELGSGEWRSPLQGGLFTSPFGDRGCIIGLPCTPLFTKHNGIDLSTGSGANVVAPADIVITAIHNSGDFDKGTYIVARAVAEPRYVMSFHHLVEGSPKVNVGDTVAVGTPIAIEGRTGMTEAVHLHFMMFPPTSFDTAPDFDNAIDPLPLLQQKGVLTNPPF